MTAIALQGLYTDGVGIVEWNTFLISKKSKSEQAYNSMTRYVVN